MLNTSIDV